MSVGIREDENTVVAVDRAELRAHVAGQAGVADGIDVERTHPLADLEPWRDVGSATGWGAFGNQRCNLVGREWRRHPHRSGRSLAALDLRPTGEALPDHQLDEARDPFFVIAHPQIFGRGNQLT